MGCDIHAIVERKGEYGRWINSGDPDVGRNYELFAALAGVRNSYGIVPVAEPKGMPGYEGWHARPDGDGWGTWGDDAPNYEYREYFERWRHDEHSASWLSLAEMKAYDATVEIDDPRLIVGRSEAGAITAVCGGTSGAHEGPVGRRRIFVWPGEDAAEKTPWDHLVAYLENVRAFHDLKDEEVRYVFFFDN